MADPITEYVDLTIDGQAYKLAIDFNAIANAEAATGCNLLHGISAAFVNTVSAAQLRGLLWAAMLRAKPKTTLAAAGALCRLDTAEAIMDGVLKAWAAGMPNKNPPQAAGAAAGES